jgi:indole-3-glycerol phosphate synthase
MPPHTRTDFLQQILDLKAERLEVAKRARPLAEIESAVAGLHRHASVGFAERLARPDTVNIIAEVKRRSPSRGIIRDDLDPVDIATAYAPWAAAISVLTEEDFFGGSLEVLRAIRERVDVPLLRKDFLFDRYQLFEAAEAGADAVLLIAAALEPQQMIDLRDEAQSLGLDVLVEVHTVAEMEAVLHCGHALIGINNRDLTTFAVDLDTSFTVARLVPDDVLLVSESGLESRTTIDALRRAGFQAFLIGEHLMRAEDPGTALRTLVE